MIKLKRIASIVLTLTLVISMFPLSAAASNKYMPSKLTMYQYSSRDIPLSGNCANANINDDTVESSNSDVCSGYCDDWLITDLDTESHQLYGNVVLYASAFGKATLTTTIAGKAEKTVVTVKNYVNPVKRLTIDGINSGKNLRSASASSPFFINLDSTKTKANAKFRITAISGWKISNISVIANYVDEKNYTFKTPRSSATVTLGTVYGPTSKSELSSKGHYAVNVTFTNTATKGTITVYYDISRKYNYNG